MVRSPSTTADTLAAYRKTMRARDEAARRRHEARREQAWHVSRQAAALLRRDHGAVRVVVFGSLAHERWFTDGSDIDLAAWGLGPEAHLVALSVLQDLDPEFSVDLVRAEWVSPRLLSAIESEGVDL